MPNKNINIIVSKLFDKDTINNDDSYNYNSSGDDDEEEYDGIKLKFIKPGLYSTEKGWVSEILIQILILILILMPSIKRMMFILKLMIMMKTFIITMKMMKRLQIF